MRFIYITFILAILTSCANKEFYISPTGNDNNPGTIEQPFLTLEKAKEAVRILIQNNPSQTITVYLRGGHYFIEKTIRFDERDCTNKGTIKYSGYKKEKAVINGGVAIRNWEKWKDGIYRAKIPNKLKNKKLYRLSDNSESAVLARHPNVGDGYGGGLRRISNTKIRIPTSWKDYDFSNSQIYGWIGSNWFAELRAVQHFNKETGILTVDPGSKNFGGLNQRIYIQGVLELLDKENEWCVHNDSIYYYPSDQTDINRRLIVAPTEPRIFDIRGNTPQNLIKNLTFENLYFNGSNFTGSWRIFEAGKDGSMPEHLQEGLIYIENANNISIKYCEIKGAGHSAVYINNKSESCTVYGCSISDAGFCGIYVNSYFPGQGGFSNAHDSYVNKGHNLSNNFIHHCGLSIGGGCGIQLFQSGNNRITHNVICEMPRYAISYKGVRNGVLIEAMPDNNINYINHFDYIHTRDNYIAYNDIFNVCRSSFDFGGIESWGAGKDNIWDGNAIHDIDQSIVWDGWAHGLFTDDGSDYVTLKNNIVFELKGGKSTGAVMVKSIGEEVSNNIFADNAIGRVATMAPYAEPAMKNIVRKNIFYKSGEMLYDINYRTFKKGYYGFYENDFNKELVKDKDVFGEVNSNLIYPYYEQLDSLKTYGWDTRSVIADPLFDKKHKQWDVTYTDYKLNSGSPAYKLGFKKINLEDIGLLNDFPFNRELIISAGSIIQAEKYNRMHELRSNSGMGIYKTEPGSWAKYENVDFGNGIYHKIIFTLKETEKNIAKKSLFEIRLGSPNGELIGTVKNSDKQTDIKKVKGIHNLFLVFQQEIRLNDFRFIE